MTYKDPTEKTFSPKEARDALWSWFAFSEWEYVRVDEMSDEAYCAVQDNVRKALGGFCIDFGHEDCGYGYCVWCEEEMEK